MTPEGVVKQVEFLDGLEKSATRVRRWVEIRFVIETVAAIACTALTARNIEQNDPWWLTTLGAVIVGCWIIAASRTFERLQSAREICDEIAEARLIFNDDDFAEFVNNLHEHARQAVPGATDPESPKTPPTT